MMVSCGGFGGTSAYGSRQAIARCVTSNGSENKVELWWQKTRGRTRTPGLTLRHFGVGSSPLQT